MRRKYFAYGSCTNLKSFKKTMKEAKCENDFQICGVGILNGYRLAFTRKSEKWDGGVLDIVESPGDYVLGVVYEIPEGAIEALDKREGVPSGYYRRIDNIKVELGFEQVEVFTYVVVDKYMDEFEPSKEYYDTVCAGMRNRFPIEYINKYLIEHCNNRFDMQIDKIQPNGLYHDYGMPDSDFIRDNPEIYELLRQMTLYFGDFNEKVETVQPTPEMFRLLTKCAEAAARGELDFGHRIPRGMYNRLASEFQRISGVRVNPLID
ncbi:MAG: gamma-glutamylcyclotransferase family protein [Bacillota bacterium]